MRNLNGLYLKIQWIKIWRVHVTLNVLEDGTLSKQFRMIFMTRSDLTKISREMRGIDSYRPVKNNYFHVKRL